MAKAAGRTTRDKAGSPQARRAAVFDLGKLLKPVSKKDPVGESLRYEGTYDAVRKARSEDDESLPRGIWETNLKRANWADVEKLCLSALAERSKDLQLAVWLTEAAFMRHGLRGLTDGLTAIGGLFDAFWADMHPQMPEDEPEYRAAPIEWLSERTAVRLRLMPINLAQDETIRPFCLSDWERARRSAPADDEERSSDEQGGPGAYRNRREMLAAAAHDPMEHYRDVVLDIDEALERVAELEARIDEHFRAVDAPGLHAMRDVLGELRQVAVRVLEQGKAMHLLNGEAPATLADQAADPAGAQTAPANDHSAKKESAVAKKAKPAAAPVSAGGPIRTRNEAYQRLEEAAAWLMENEPHSPTPYLIQRAVSWRDKSLVELLSELVPDDGYRGFLQSLFGAGRVSHDDDYESEGDMDEWNNRDDDH